MYRVGLVARIPLIAYLRDTIVPLIKYLKKYFKYKRRVTGKGGPV